MRSPRVPAAPRMPRGQGELDELYRHLFCVVGEGFHDIALMIDHRELLRCERQKRALKEDGKKNDEEGDMEDDVIHRRLRISDDGKDDGRGAAKACEGDQSACGSGRLKGARRAKTPRGLATKVRKSAMRKAGHAISGSFDGVERSPSRKKIIMERRFVAPLKK